MRADLRGRMPDGTGLLRGVGENAAGLRERVDRRPHGLGCRGDDVADARTRRATALGGTPEHRVVSEGARQTLHNLAHGVERGLNRFRITTG